MVEFFLVSILFYFEMRGSRPIPTLAAANAIGIGLEEAGKGFP